MKHLVLSLCFLVMSLSANAGFEALDQGSSLKVASALNCDVGLTCSKKRGTVSVSATHIGAIEAAVAGTLTAAKCGKTFYNTAAVELDLPEASTVLGCRYTFVTLNASNFDIDPDDADQILVQTDAAGDRTRNATVGNSITLEAVSASQWAVVGILGTWSDAN